MASLKRLRRRPSAAAAPPATPATEGRTVDLQVDPVARPEGDGAADLGPDLGPDDGPDDGQLEGERDGRGSDHQDGGSQTRGRLRRTSAIAGSGVTRVATSTTRTAGRLAGRSLTWQLLRAAHPRQGLLTAFGVAAAAALVGRPGREIAVVFLTVAVGQTVLGWHNDLVDEERDTRHYAEGRTTGKPLAEGRLESGTVWFALACALLLLLPLSVSTGVTAASCYLLSVGIGVLGHYVLRRGAFSWITWAGAYALLPAYVAYGGWGGGAEGPPPEALMTLLAAALGVGIHAGRSLFGLVPDHHDGWTYWPLRLSLRLGATRMLIYTGAYLALITAAMILVGASLGLRQ